MKLPFFEELCRNYEVNKKGEYSKTEKKMVIRVMLNFRNEMHGHRRYEVTESSFRKWAHDYRVKPFCKKWKRGSESILTLYANILNKYIL